MLNVVASVDEAMEEVAVAQNDLIGSIEEMRRALEEFP